MMDFSFPFQGITVYAGTGWLEQAWWNNFRNSILARSEHNWNKPYGVLFQENDIDKKGILWKVTKNLKESGEKGDISSSFSKMTKLNLRNVFSSIALPMRCGIGYKEFFRIRFNCNCYKMPVPPAKYYEQLKNIATERGVNLCMNHSAQDYQLLNY